MMPINVRKSISSFLLIVFTVSQIGVLGSVLLLPKPAHACQFLGTGPDCTFQLVDVYDAVKNVVTGIIVRIAQNYANKYLTKFTQKLQDKYRIKDFLFYDQYLSDYYVTKLISRNVKDPDLKRALELFAGVTITGRTQGYTGTDPRKALIPQLKKEINKIYIEQGGTDSGYVYRPSRTMTNRDYFSAAQSYFYNPPSYTEQRIAGQFGAFESAATTAAKLEITVGNSLKAGRVIGGTCNLAEDIPGVPITEGLPYIPGTSLPSEPAPPGSFPEVPGTPLPPEPPPPTAPPTTQNWDPVTCVAAGGQWQASALDQARSFITNPTAFTEKMVAGALNQIFGINYNPNNIFTAIGSALGDFIFNQLELKDQNGVFNEEGSVYSPHSEVTARVVDQDADGISDGEDKDDDGKLISIVDVCYHGGLPPNCQNSSEVTTSSYFYPICKAADDAVKELTEWNEFQERNKYQNQGTENLWPQYREAANIWGEKGAQALGKVNNLIQVIKDFNAENNDVYESNLFVINKYGYFLDKIVQSLFADGDVDLSMTFWSNGGGTWYNLRVNTIKIRDYLKDFRVAINKCAQPDPAAANVPDPGIEVPTGGSENGVGNDPGAPTTINESDIIWIDRDVGGWAQTANLGVSLNLAGGQITLDSSKKNEWPAIRPDEDEVNANAWILVWRQGKWYAGTWEYMRPGQDTKSTQNLQNLGALKGELSNFIAQPGETYGFMVSGLARNDLSNVEERSNIVMVLWQ
ncbi:MAG: hypothetical protein HY395_00765 [Candidatus Doudnabacteria bacterium]|nr:hypothetical protein [Candidatus Doudnabacteria bacterium]